MKNLSGSYLSDGSSALLYFLFNNKIQSFRFKNNAPLYSMERDWNVSGTRGVFEKIIN